MVAIWDMCSDITSGITSADSDSQFLCLLLFPMFIIVSIDAIMQKKWESWIKKKTRM